MSSDYTPTAEEQKVLNAVKSILGRNAYPNARELAQQTQMGTQEVQDALRTLADHDVIQMRTPLTGPQRVTWAE